MPNQKNLRDPSLQISLCRPLTPLFRGFDTSLEALLPQCCGVLMTNTGYLGPADLDEFDKVTNGSHHLYCRQNQAKSLIVWGSLPSVRVCTLA